jgi:hypothetical protein
MGGGMGLENQAFRNPLFASLRSCLLLKNRYSNFLFLFYWHPTAAAVLNPFGRPACTMGPTQLALAQPAVLQLQGADPPPPFHWDRRVIQPNHIKFRICSALAQM